MKGGNKWLINLTDLTAFLARYFEILCENLIALILLSTEIKRNLTFSKTSDQKSFLDSFSVKWK